jgi:hypothetical protein
LNILEPVKEADVDVDSALANLDFGNVKGKEGKHAEHNFSTVAVHDTAKEVVEAESKKIEQSANAAVGDNNVFDDFKLDTLDVSGMKAESLDTKVDFDGKFLFFFFFFLISKSVISYWRQSPGQRTAQRRAQRRTQRSRPCQRGGEKSGSDSGREVQGWIRKQSCNV